MITLKNEHDPRNGFFVEFIFASQEPLAGSGDKKLAVWPFAVQSDEGLYLDQPFVLLLLP